MSSPDFDNQTLAVLRGRMVRYLMRSREVRQAQPHPVQFPLPEFPCPISLPLTALCVRCRFLVSLACVDPSPGP